MTQTPTAVDRLRKADKTHTPFGIFISSIDPASTEIAGLSGYDFVMIDGEHSALDRQEILAHVRAAEAVGVVPLVRGLYKTQEFIQSMLDLGVAGVVLPKLETAEEARTAFAATRYAPEGTRGMCPACHDGGYSITGFGERMKRRNREAMVIPIIETRKAVENIEEICAVDGMDLIHFGPGDLSADMGLDLATEIHLLQDAWVRVRDAAHAAGKFAFVPSGMNFEGGDVYISSMELMQMREKLTQTVQEFRQG
ncbi:MAG: aldolase/citrate lyase family protein [Octadecabacter sp.]|jgi:2-keto-3-deoxy-L-rhamnonate aldolase RhmA